jgi:hypothetical protein
MQSEPGVSGGCVADPVARAKEALCRRDTFTVPLGAQPAGRINRPYIVNRGRPPVNYEALGGWHGLS